VAGSATPPSDLSPYARLGGDEGVFSLVRRFYQQMDTLDEAVTIREMHAGDLEPMIDKLAVFLISWMGGPRNYEKRFGRVIIPLAHQPFAIGPAERDAWLMCMAHALDEVGAEPDLVDLLMDAFFRMAEMCRTDR
jgi:hemoglobin